MSTRNVISAKHLGEAAQKAADAAAKRHKLQFQPEYTIAGLINGRVLRELDVNLKTAVQAAQEITEEVAKAGGAAGPGALPKPTISPAVYCYPGHIICGFILDPQETVTFEKF